MSPRKAPTVRVIKRKQKPAAIGPDTKKYLLCRPDHYQVEYAINAWMNVSVKADRTLAIENWNSLSHRITEFGGYPVYVKPRETLPDMVFTANAALVVKGEKKVILSNFKHDERKNEEQWFLEWFLESGYHVVYPDLPFEGAGDALYLGDTLVCGWGFRTEEAVYDWIAGQCPHDQARVKLVNPNFYHLDTCFCPLNDKDYLIYPGAFDEGGLATIRQLQGNEIAVCEEEAHRFACNAVVVGDAVVLPAGCPQTTLALEKAGYRTASVSMTEFLKSGGACKCLTLAL